MNPNDVNEQEGPIYLNPLIEVEFIGNYINPYLPQYHSESAAGFDLMADIKSPITLKAGDTIMVDTGLKFGLPLGYEVQIRSRSGLAAKSGIFVLNSPGTIDEDYTGPIKIILANFGNSGFVIEPGMRIAQGVLATYTQATFEAVQAVSKTTVRGVGGFGSSGL
jgi:dUTP pyrophosphatase